MALPITPAFQADLVVLERITVNYKPTWDGAAWVLTPADIEVYAGGRLAQSGNEVIQADITVPLLSLPAAGQQALQDLHGYMEEELQTKYT